MSKKIKLDGEEYLLEDLSDQAQAALKSLQFVTTKVQELTNMQALLQRAKNSYVDSLKKEMLSSKGGFLLGDD
jgi:hypothetical protein